MCRYDDDEYAWFVDSEHADDVSDVDRRCEDCGRTIPAGEPHVRFVAIENEDSEFTDREYVFLAQDPAVWPTDASERSYQFVHKDLPYFKIADEEGDAYTALGFFVDEVADPDYVPKIEQHYSCSQCRLAADWLTKVCSQSVVLVTCEDLDSHADEYEPDQLGPHFLALNRLCSRQWAYRRSNRLVPPGVVARATARAVAHAERVGLHP